MSRLATLMSALLLVWASMSAAHEVRPASLEITESGQGHVLVYWRQPVTGNYTIAVSPVLSSGWLQREPDERLLNGDSLVKVWRIGPPHEPLGGQTLYIKGLDRTITDTFVRIRTAGGMEQQALIKPVSPGIRILELQPGERPLPGYLRFGFAHIWSGADHLVYILGLVLLIANLRSLVVTITAFTIAHSITLGCAAAGLVSAPAAPVEAAIALSIVYVATELVRMRQGRAGLAGRSPWVIAFLFGLLHGFGFAGALLRAGLPEDAMLSALLLFNLGIEAGQLVFLAAVLLVLKLCQTLLPRLRQLAVQAAPYGIGSVASFWLIQRVAAFL